MGLNPFKFNAATHTARVESKVKLFTSLISCKSSYVRTNKLTLDSEEVLSFITLATRSYCTKDAEETRAIPNLLLVLDIIKCSINHEL